MARPFQNQSIAGGTAEFFANTSIGYLEIKCRLSYYRRLTVQITVRAIAYLIHALLDPSKTRVDNVNKYFILALKGVGGASTD